MEIEYLEYEYEVIDLGDALAHASEAQAEEAAAEAVVASWFTDGRSHNACQPTAPAH